MQDFLLIDLSLKTMSKKNEKLRACSGDRRFFKNLFLN